MRISDWSSDVCSSDLSDADGFLIAEALASTCDEADRELQLWLMGQFPTQDANLELSDRDVARIEYITQRRGWDGHFSVIQTCGKGRSEEHTSELQSLMRISYAVFCLKKTKQIHTSQHYAQQHKQIR